MQNRSAVWSVYILRCGDDSLYTGISTDVHARLKTHQAGKGARYTRGRTPLVLAYQEEVGTQSDALKRELVIKKMRRDEKEKMMEKPRCRNCDKELDGKFVSESYRRDGDIRRVWSFYCNNECYDAHFKNIIGVALGANLGPAPEILPPKYDIAKRDSLWKELQELKVVNPRSVEQSGRMTEIEIELERIFTEAYGTKGGD